MACCSFIIGAVALIFTIFKVYLKLTTGICKSQRCLLGKTAVVTGANTGIGYETALDFAKRGAKVILACRNQERAETAKSKIIYESGNENIHVKVLDTASLKSVRQCAEDLIKTEERLDILVNNCGAGFLPNETTEDGMNLVMQTNYFGPFLFTVLLLPLLKKTKDSRIVNVSSMAAESAKLNLQDLNEHKSQLGVYANSKLCNILFTKELARRLRGCSVTSYSLHPGVIATEFGRNLPGWFLLIISPFMYPFCKDCFEGAQTQIYCAVAKGIEEFSGRHFHDCEPVKDYKTVKEEDFGKLWDITEKLVKVKQS